MKISFDADWLTQNENSLNYFHSVSANQRQKIFSFIFFYFLFFFIFSRQKVEKRSLIGSKYASLIGGDKSEIWPLILGFVYRILFLYS